MTQLNPDDAPDGFIAVASNTQSSVSVCEGCAFDYGPFTEDSCTRCAPYQRGDAMSVIFIPRPAAAPVEQAAPSMLKQAADFQRACKLLPEGVSWGGALTPPIALHIASAQQAAQPEALEKAAPTPMTAHRAAWFLERFKRDEKLLGPNEQKALLFAIEALEGMSAQHAAQPVAQEPAGRLYADGYFTWHRRDGYVLDRRLPCDFYLTLAAPSPVALSNEQVAAAWKAWPRQAITSAARAIEFVRTLGIQAGKDGA